MTKETKSFADTLQEIAQRIDIDRKMYAVNLRAFLAALDFELPESGPITQQIIATMRAAATLQTQLEGAVEAHRRAEVFSERPTEPNPTVEPHPCLEEQHIRVDIMPPMRLSVGAGEDFHAFENFFRLMGFDTREDV